MENGQLFLPNTTATLIPQEILTLAQEVNDKYPNLSIAWIPPEDRGEGDDRPFAIVQVDGDGNIQQIILRMHQLEVHGAYVFNWLWENDSQRMDPWQKYLKQVEAERNEKQKRETERINELAEVVHSVAKSNKHTYRINGHKIGAENNFPTLGLNDAR